MLRRILFMIPLVLLEACTSKSLPPPPQGMLCVVSVADKGKYCEPMSSAVKHIQQVPFEVAQDAVFIPFERMDNDVDISAPDWKGIQTYIGLLKIQAQKQCSKGSESEAHTR